MAEGEDVKALAMRVRELENLLQQYQTPEISADEMKAFVKVSNALAMSDLNCGINECRPVVRICRICALCRICRLCRMCDVECTCGPCNVGGTGGDRFVGFGD